MVSNYFIFEISHSFVYEISSDVQIYSLGVPEIQAFRFAFFVKYFNDSFFY